MRSPPAPPDVRLSRRRALLAVASALACDSGEVVPPAPPRAVTAAPAAAPASATATPSAGTPSAPSAASGASAAPESAPGLDVLRLGPLREDERGGLLVVLLHGWRAPGDDLAGLAERLAQPRQRYLVPAAPLPEPNGGRSWWRLDGASRPAHAYRDEVPADYTFNPQLLAARRAVQALLRDALQRYAPDAIALAGFSQGAMLALDVALAADPPVARVAVLSGTLVVDSLPSLRSGHASRPAVFVAHGRRDARLPFAAAEAIPKVLSAHGYPVTFFPFDGGHQISPAVVSELRGFLAAATR